MSMELAQLGFSAQSHDIVESKHTLVSIVRGESIKLLWSSWCDAVIAHQDGRGLWSVEYAGTGLTSAQGEYIANSKDIKDAMRGNPSPICFFGGVMHQGLLGFVIPRDSVLGITSQIVFFATDFQVESGIPDIQSYTLVDDFNLLGVQVASGGDILVSVKHQTTGEAHILPFPDLSQFRQCLASKSPIYSTQSPVASFFPTQWCTNATTSTALDDHGRVYTSTRDLRYPKCLGRPSEGSSGFEPVPYLSETRISNIASGGYMTAAVSSDGELFLWGQACPGTSSDLSVLNESMVDQESHPIGSKGTGIWVESEQDEFVKCLTVCIDHEPAHVYAVAIGHGHIVVAAEVFKSGSNRKRVIFSAGDNSTHQLGLDTEKEFIEDFMEVEAIPGEYVEQLGAAGWSTIVIKNRT